MDIIKYLTLLRHGERINKNTEELKLNSILSLEKLGLNLPNFNYHYHSIKKRTQNTLNALISEKKNFIFEKGLSYTPKNWENIPWKKDIIEFKKMYEQGEKGTINLANFHANLYNNLFSNSLSNQKSIGITHDSRIEAAIVALNVRGLLSEYNFDQLKEQGNFNYGEGVEFGQTIDGFYVPISVIKGGKIIEL